MTTEKRKEQLREGAKKLRAKKKAEGFIGFYALIRPEERPLIMKYIKKIRGKLCGS